MATSLQEANEDPEHMLQRAAIDNRGVLKTGSGQQKTSTGSVDVPDGAAVAELLSDLSSTTAKRHPF